MTLLTLTFGHCAEQARLFPERVVRRFVREVRSPRGQCTIPMGQEVSSPVRGVGAEGRDENFVVVSPQQSQFQHSPDTQRAKQRALAVRDLSRTTAILPETAAKRRLFGAADSTPSSITPPPPPILDARLPLNALTLLHSWVRSTSQGVHAARCRTHMPAS